MGVSLTGDSKSLFNVGPMVQFYLGANGVLTAKRKFLITWNECITNNCENVINIENPYQHFTFFVVVIDSNKNVSDLWFMRLESRQARFLFLVVNITLLCYHLSGHTCSSLVITFKYATIKTLLPSWKEMAIPEQ
jgi:hypothetical protein